MNKHIFPSAQAGVTYCARPGILYYDGAPLIGPSQFVGPDISREILRLVARERELTARIATLEAEVESELQGQAEISESSGRAFEKWQERERKLREALGIVTGLLAIALPLRDGEVVTFEKLSLPGAHAALQAARALLGE